MDRKKDIDPEAAAAAVVGFIGGVAVGHYVLDEILGREELEELKKRDIDILYKCPKCNEALRPGNNYCPGCGVALQWRKK